MTGVTSVQARVSAPRGGESGGHIVRPGDTLSEIAQRNGVSLRSLIAANPQIGNPNLIRPGQQVIIPAGSGAQSYTVRPGDTLSEIGQRFGVSWQSLARENGISNPNLILPGRTLSIPSGGSSNGSSGAGAVGGTAPAGGGSGDIAATARQYLGQNASSLKTNTSDNLPMDPNVPSNVCCANFVSAVLTESGHLPQSQHTNSVDQLDSTLRARGWQEVPASQARPGDVVIIQGGGVSHTVIVNGPGQTIGSNNSNDDGSQRVTTGSLDWALSKGGKILRAPDAGGTSAGGRAEGTGGAGATNPSGQGTRTARINQAVAYFESQGWSRAQSIGIVANLDLESRMEPGIDQIGGGPGYGLAQWEGPRQRDFAAWSGHDIRGSSFAEQLRFVQHELTGTERAAGNALRGATDARSAAEIVCRLYERPADIPGDSAERMQRASEIAGW